MATKLPAALPASSKAWSTQQCQLPKVLFSATVKRGLRPGLPPALKISRPLLSKSLTLYGDSSVLVAEEVADVYPGLVQFDKGEPQTVLYHVLPAMLLNEVQKQQREIEALEKLIQSQQEQLKAQEERLRRLEPSLLSKGN